MCKVLNAKQVGKLSTPDRIYVGRPSKWGNPFVIGRDGTRGEVIAKYQAWIAQQPSLMAALHELRGKNLVCWCAPERCHADVLLTLANRHRLKESGYIADPNDCDVCAASGAQWPLCR